jgi:hypothetical protein
MAKDSYSSGVPGSTTNGDNAKAYEPPAQNDSDTSFIKGFGTPSPKSIEKKIDANLGQSKTPNC